MDQCNLDIFQFTNYRAYMRELYQLNKQKDRKYSLNFFAQRLGVSKMFFRYLINEERHISYAQVSNFTNFLKLTKEGSQYFFELVLFAKEKDLQKRDEHLQRLLKYRKSCLSDYYLKSTEMQICDQWYYPVLAELSYTKGFSEDPKWIRANLNLSLSATEIKQAIKKLKSIGYFNGSSIQENKIKVPDDIKSHVYKKFVSQNIKISSWAMDNLPKADRQSFNITVSVSEQKFQIAKQMIEEFRHKLHDTLSGDKDCDRVVQINTQLFSMTKSGSSNA